MGTIRVSNSLDPDQDRHCVGPDLCPNCLQSLSANNKFIYVMEHLPCVLGAQWLSGRVLDSKLRGHGFEPHRRHCVVVLEQDTFILA